MNNNKNDELHQQDIVTVRQHTGDEPWYRFFSPIFAFSWPMFASLGAVAAYFNLWQYIKLDFFSTLGITAEIYGVGIVAGIISGVIATAANYFMSGAQAQLALKDNPNREMVLDSWKMRIRSGAYIGAQVGSLMGFIVAAATVPQLKALPLYNTVFNAILYGAGSLVGGIVGLACYPAIQWLNRYLSHSSIYRKFISLLDNSNTANPATERLNAGVESGYYAGVVMGAVLGSVVPGLGTIIGMGLGGATGAISGAIIGYLSEGVINYFKDPATLQKVSNNPWSARIQTGSFMGIFLGLILNAIFPGIGLALGVAIGAACGATLAVVAEPFYKQFVVPGYLSRSAEKQKLDYPWSTRAYIGSAVFCVIGAAVGFGVGGPAGAILGAGIGGVSGGVVGMACVAPVQKLLKQGLAYLPLIGQYFAETNPTSSLDNKSDTQVNQPLSETFAKSAKLLSSKEGPNPAKLVRSSIRDMASEQKQKNLLNCSAETDSSAVNQDVSIKILVANQPVWTDKKSVQGETKNQDAKVTPETSAEDTSLETWRSSLA